MYVFSSKILKKFCSVEKNIKNIKLTINSIQKSKDKTLKKELKEFYKKYSSKQQECDKNNTTFSFTDIIDNSYNFWRLIDILIIYTDTLINQHNIDNYNFKYLVFEEFNNTSFATLRQVDNKVTFENITIFHNAQFKKGANFDNCTFKKKVGFNASIFEEDSSFKHSRLEGEAYFRETNFKKNVDFGSCRFNDTTFEDIIFPVSKKDKIKILKVTVEKFIWTGFATYLQVEQIEANRETFARLKKVNADNGNFIDSNIFYIKEANTYLGEVSSKLGKSLKFWTNENKQPFKFRKFIALVQDWLSFGIAKWTSNYGINWLLPLVYIVIIIAIHFYSFKPNEDYKATQNTAMFVLENNNSKLNINEFKKTFCINKTSSSNNLYLFNFNKIRYENNDSCIYMTNSVEDMYFAKNIYKDFQGEFQDKTDKILKTGVTTSLMFSASCLIPPMFSESSMFVTLNESAYFWKMISMIVLWYLIGAFGFALKNKTKRQ